MRCTQSSTIVSMEELVEMDVIPEMGISVEFGVPTINGSSTMFISAKEMDESMLDFLGTSSEVHELLVSLVRRRGSELTSPLPVGHST